MSSSESLEMQSTAANQQSLPPEALFPWDLNRRNTIKRAQNARLATPLPTRLSLRPGMLPLHNRYSMQEARLEEQQITSLKSEATVQTLVLDQERPPLDRYAKGGVLAPDIHSMANVARNRATRTWAGTRKSGKDKRGSGQSDNEQELSQVSKAIAFRSLVNIRSGASNGKGSQSVFRRKTLLKENVERNSGDQLLSGSWQLNGSFDRTDFLTKSQRPAGRNSNESILIGDSQRIMTTMQGTARGLNTEQFADSFTAKMDKMPSELRFSANMSPEAQFCFLKGYEDVLVQSIADEYAKESPEDALERTETPPPYFLLHNEFRMRPVTFEQGQLSQRDRTTGRRVRIAEDEPKNQMGVTGNTGPACPETKRDNNMPFDWRNTPGIVKPRSNTFTEGEKSGVTLTETALRRHEANTKLETVMKDEKTKSTSNMVKAAEKEKQEEKKRQRKKTISESSGDEEKEKEKAGGQRTHKVSKLLPESDQYCLMSHRPSLLIKMESIAREAENRRKSLPESENYCRMEDRHKWLKPASIPENDFYGTTENPPKVSKTSLLGTNPYNKLNQIRRTKRPQMSVGKQKFGYEALANTVQELESRFSHEVVYEREEDLPARTVTVAEGVEMQLGVQARPLDKKLQKRVPKTSQAKKISTTQIAAPKPLMTTSMTNITHAPGHFRTWGITPMPSIPEKSEYYHSGRATSSGIRLTKGESRTLLRSFHAQNQAKQSQSKMSRSQLESLSSFAPALGSSSSLSFSDDDEYSPSTSHTAIPGVPSKTPKSTVPAPFPQWLGNARGSQLTEVFKSISEDFNAKDRAQRALGMLHSYRIDCATDIIDSMREKKGLRVNSKRFMDRKMEPVNDVRAWKSQWPQDFGFVKRKIPGNYLRSYIFTPLAEV